MGHRVAMPAVARCPIHFDPFSSPYLDDPYAVFPTLLAEDGPRYWEDLGYWLVARHEQVEAIFRDPETFSAAIAQDPLQAPHPDAAAVLANGFRPLKTMSNLDGPEHTRIRRHTQVGFAPRRLRAMEPIVRAQAVEVIDALPLLGEVELVERLTHPLPATVIFRLLGFPPEDTPMLKSWCGDRMAFSWGRPDRDAQVRIASDMVAYWQYCERHVATQLADPGDHFTGDLLRIHLADPSTLSTAEITSVIYGLSFAGHETTTNLLGNTIRRLLAHRERWGEIVEDPGRIDAAVLEAVRHDSSVVTWRRITTRDAVVGDVTIPAGSKVLLLLGAANHDPARFEAPGRFDPTRDNAADALSFGWGKHYCLGAVLAKLEVKVVLEELAARRPGLHLLPQRFEFNPNVSFRGPKRLRVELR
ncbi:MAG: cytochrome P450 [Acidimicrobiales bacterium]